MAFSTMTEQSIIIFNNEYDLCFRNDITHL